MCPHTGRNTEDPRYNDSIYPQDFAVKKNLPLYRIPTCTNIINDKKPFSPYLLQETYVVDICKNRLANKYPQHIWFLG